MASKTETMELVVRRLTLLYQPPHPQTVNGQPNLAYAELCEQYVNALAPYPTQRIRAGMDALVTEYRGSKWPSPGLILDFIRNNSEPPPALPPVATRPADNFSDAHWWHQQALQRDMTARRRAYELYPGLFEGRELRPWSWEMRDLPRNHVSPRDSRAYKRDEDSLAAKSIEDRTYDQA